MALVDIYAIDNSRSDLVMWVDSALTSGDIGIKNVADLATYVAIRCSGGDTIRELRIIGHGNADGQWFGSDWIGSSYLRYHAANLRKIGRCFNHPKGFVTLGGCKVGQNPILLGQLSMYFGVPVRAFTASQNPAIPGDEGAEVKCYLLSCSKGCSTLLDRVGY